jgi:ubiquinone/menaquinone biosynthesis C-methylase UbiE
VLFPVPLPTLQQFQMCDAQSSRTHACNKNSHGQTLSSSSSISRFNAWFFDVVDRYSNHVGQVHKRNAFEGLRTGTIVELGAGTGANLRYIPEGSRLIAVEPNAAMHARLQRNAAAQKVDLELLASPGEDVPLADDSVDEVIATLVLCTVADPDRVLSEIRRILRPGGTFRFVEHIAAHPASPRRWLQWLIARPWAWLFEGCDTQRDTTRAIANAGFSTMIVESKRFRHSVFFPVNSAIWGFATNGDS